MIYNLYDSLNILDNAGFLPEQIWVSLPDPTDLPLSDFENLGKNLPIWGEKMPI